MTDVRVAFVHSPARSGVVTGEDLAASAQAHALRNAGVDLLELTADAGMAPLSRVVAQVASAKTNRLPLSVRELGVDVVHIHKWFPWMRSYDFGRLGVPFVVTLHNFRPLCPVGTLFRDGRFCDLCAAGPPVGLVRHACFRGSVLKSCAVGLTHLSNPKRHEMFGSAAALVAPSDRAARIVQSYVPDIASKMHIIPSFVARNRFLSVSRTGWLFVGQLEETKGIRNLIEAWPRGEKLTVVGSGSQSELLARIASEGSKQVSFMGALPNFEVEEQMSLHEGVVFPSAYLETQGLVVGEAAAAKTPVIALRGTAGADQVLSGSFGVVIDKIADIPGAIKKVRDGTDRFSQSGFDYWDGTLREEVWIRKIVQLYAQIA